ncbi:hypothetical protein [Bradyrhizobium sp. USDA 3364]
MPNAPLHLILCSDDVEHEAKQEARRGERDRSFQPVVIDGGKQTDGAPTDDPWIGLLDVFDFGVAVCQASYLAVMMAGLAALQLRANGPDPGS